MPVSLVPSASPNPQVVNRLKRLLTLAEEGRPTEISCSCQVDGIFDLAYTGSKDLVATLGGIERLKFHTHNRFSPAEVEGAI